MQDLTPALDPSTRDPRTRIADIGPDNAISVTFLLPVFAVVRGVIFLGEKVSGVMVLRCAINLLGSRLATGLRRLHQTGGFERNKQP